MPPRLFYEMKAGVNVKAVLFDLDGTLFRTEEVGVPAFQETFRILKNEGIFQGDVPSAEKIQSVFGMTHEEIWQTLLPNADDRLKSKADQLMLDKEIQLFREGRGKLYPGVEETLNQLAETGYSLFIASNGSGPYVRTALETQGLIHLFKGIYTAGEYHTKTKVDLVKICKEENGIIEGFMVGDRSSDMRAGKENGLVTIGCRYVGFAQFGRQAELADAHHIIQSFPELLSVILERSRS